MDIVNDVIISHNSVISLHIQLHNQLRQLILSGRWPHGTHIPSESQFANHLKVSRTTVRLALQQAELEGLIERIPGRGTFVAYQDSTDHKHRLIAFVTRGFDAENTLMLLHGAESEAKARGYEIIFSHPQSYAEEIDTLQRLRGANVAGVLIWPHAHASKPQQQNAVYYQQVGLPIVLMDRLIYGGGYDCITSDNYGGAQMLTRHLIEQGHQHVVFLSHHETELISVIERYQGYSDTVQAAGLTPAAMWLIGEPGHETSVSDMLRASIDLNSLELQQIKRCMETAQPRPTAIFALNDYVAILAARAMKLLNLQVPCDVSIVGFDDTELASQLEIPLTTVAQDSFAIGNGAARRLINRLEGYNGPVEREIIPTQLRIRSSTAVPSKKEVRVIE
ncbi:MAG TPA: GntR family transcriptional regulator [Phototrophicaceae bacterium]|nr:GntR family transcriptional regulator [Phototrophicaceae bacterium]